MLRFLLLSSIILAVANVAGGAEPAAGRTIEGIVYRTVDRHELKLDLHLPKNLESDVPCVIFVHGGGWKNGDRKSGQKNAAWLIEHGFAVAAIDYRLTDVARWPAQIDDCYAAVRWVRTSGRQHGIDPRRIGVWGTSAGAHLAALLGTRADPGVSNRSTRVQAVCDWFGPTDLLTMPPNNVGDGRSEEDVANSNGAKLLGHTVRDVPRLARDASALYQVSGDDPPFLIMHGADDPGVPLSQSQRLHAALTKAGVPSRLHVIEGAGHGGKEFKTPAAHTLVVDFFSRTLKSNWNQGAGPRGNFVVGNESAPKKWSVVDDLHIRWRKVLPETGQSTVVTWGKKIFFTTMKPVQEDSALGSDIVAWCCDADSGETLWTREIPGEYPLRLSGCFADSSSPPPVTDGRNVCFFNASGTIACFDLDGNPVWQKEMMAVGRSQPVLIDGNVVFIKQSYMPDEQGHFSHDHKNAPLKQWTQLQALDIQSGKPVWTSTCGVNMGCVPLPMTLSDGRRVMVVGRGGGHSPPEKPEGVSMVDATDGSTIWTVELPKFMSTMAFHVSGDQVLVFDAGDHLWIDAASGEIRRRVSFITDVDVRFHQNGRWATEKRSVQLGNKTRAIIQQSNVLAGNYHYFRSYTQPWIGRVHVDTGQVECLQLPVQQRVTGGKRQWLWDPSGMPADVVAQTKKSLRKPSQVLPIQQWAYAPNDMRNSRGHVVMGDKRSMGNGWGHHASQIPSVVGNHLYLPTMSGTVYVLRADCEKLDEQAIVAINDLGPVGQSWNRASLSYADGRLYAHTIREVICVE